MLFDINGVHTFKERPEFRINKVTLTIKLEYITFDDWLDSIFVTPGEKYTFFLNLSMNRCFKIFNAEILVCPGGKMSEYKFSLVADEEFQTLTVGEWFL